MLEEEQNKIMKSQRINHLRDLVRGVYVAAAVIGAMAGGGIATAQVQSGSSFMIYAADANTSLCTASIQQVTSAGVVSTFSSGTPSPTGLVLDGSGNLYESDTNGTISKISRAGVVSTFETGFGIPAGLAIDASGNLYVAEYALCQVSKITPNGNVSVFATGSDSEFGSLDGMTIDGSGNLYVSNAYDGTIDKVTPGGAVSEFAFGFDYPLCLAATPNGDLFVGDITGNITEITASRAKVIFASGFNDPSGIILDGSGNLYVVDISGTIFKINPFGGVSTLASGVGAVTAMAIALPAVPPTITAQPPNQNSTPNLDNATFSIAATGDNIAYQWQVSSDGGATWTPLSNDSTYSGVTSPTLTVANITLAMTGYEYKCVASNTGGSATSDPATLTYLPFIMYVQGDAGVLTVTPDRLVHPFSAVSPSGIVVDSSGNVYVGSGDSIIIFTPAGVSGTFATGLGPIGEMALDGNRNLYVVVGSSDDGGSYSLKKITPSGTPSTVVAKLATEYPDQNGLVCDSAGNIYLSNYDLGTITKITPSGATTPFLNGLDGSLAIDKNDNLYVSNSIEPIINKVTPDKTVSTYAQVVAPGSLALDGNGNLYVITADTFGAGPSSAILKITPAGVVSTFSNGPIWGAIAITSATASTTTAPYVIATSASPSAGGIVAGGGTFPAGSPSLQTLTATANSSYIFANWTSNGTVVSSAATYTVQLNGNINLNANFNRINYLTLDATGAANGTYLTGVSGSNIVGYYIDSANNSHSFLYNGTTFTTLSDSNGFDIGAIGISGSNILAYDTGNISVFFFSDGICTNIGNLTPPNADDPQATGIDGNNIVGIASDNNATMSSFLYAAGVYSIIGYPNNISQTYVTGISGDYIVGDSNVPSNLGISHGFLYNGASYSTLDDPDTFVACLEANGVDGRNIVGRYQDCANIHLNHGFFFNGDHYTTVDDPNGIGASFCTGISGNTIIGRYTDGNNLNHGFVATIVAPSPTPIPTYTITPIAGVNGSITPDSPQTVSSGSSITFTAAPDADCTVWKWLFNNAPVPSSGTGGTTCTFTPSSSGTLDVIFQLTTLAGTYDGLLLDGSGYVTITILSNNTFTGKVTISGSSHSFQGAFNIDGYGVATYPPSFPATLQLAAGQGGAASTYSITGTVDGAAFTAWHAANPDQNVLEAGKYTILLSATANGGSTPHGSGFATLTVSKNGGIIMAGKLPDGTAFSASALLLGGSNENQFMIDTPLSYPSVSKKGDKGSLAGTLTFMKQTGTSGLNGTLTWNKPPQSKGPWAAAIDTTLNVIGSFYQPPANGQRVLEFSNVEGNGEFIAQDGGSVWSGTDIVTLSAANTIAPLPGGTDKLSLRMNTSNGTVTGSFVPPGGTAPVSVNGVIFQIQNIASGFFLSGTESGKFDVGANPEFGPTIVSGSLNGPVVTITSPAANVKIGGTDQITFTGKASDGHGVAAVYYQILYSGSIGTLQTASGTTNWSFTIPPAPDAGGIYTVYVQAVDGKGNASAPLARCVTCVVPSPLVVTVSGKGTVSAGYGGQTGGTTQQDIGLTHSITANPGAGQVFTGWTGGIQSASRTLTFTMQAGLTLQANFVPKP